METWNTQKTRLLINNNNKYVNGDILDATSLNAVIDEVITTADLMATLMEGVLSQVMRYDFSSVVWFQGSDKNKIEIDIALGFIRLYADIKCTNLITTKVINEPNRINISLTESTTLKEASSKVYDIFEYKVTFYLDELKQTKLVERSSTIKYFYKSTSPGFD